MSRRQIQAVFVNGPKAGEVMVLEGDPDTVVVEGIDFVPGVWLKDQRVTTERGYYERTYFDTTIDGVPAWRFEWRGWSGIPDPDPS